MKTIGTTTHAMAELDRIAMTVATFPAFDVVDLGQEVITITAQDCESFSEVRFCTSYESRRYGTMYRECSPNCVDYYCANDEGGIEVAVERNQKNGGTRFWFNNCACSITAHDRPKYTLILIKEGQLVTMAGYTLKVRIVGEHIRLDVVGLPA